MLRQGLHIEPEKRIDETGAVYLGCRHVVSSVKLPNGTTATTMTYDMEYFLQSCIEQYKSVIGPKVSLRPYSTPFMPEDHRDSPAGAPGAGPVRECQWCFLTDPPQSVAQYQSVDKLPVRRKPKTETSVGSTMNDGKSVSTDGKHDHDEGALASVACSLLMKVLWVARLARPDLPRAVNYLATKVSKWTSKCDSMLHRLMGYIQATLHLRMMGWIGDSLDKLYPHFFNDADLQVI